MIYTVTLNPSIDYIVKIDSLTMGAVNRMDEDFKYPGGKGINVSRILKRLDIPTKATGFIGGFTGQFILDSLAQEGVETEFVTVSTDSRINIKLKSEEETEINGVGPTISDDQLQTLETILSCTTKDDIVVFAGSAPFNLTNKIYQELIPIAKQNGAAIVCDFEGQTLVDSLVHQPLLVKPNHHELAAIYNVTLNTIDDIVSYGEKLLAQGAQHAIVSMAGDGALLITKAGNYFAKPIKGNVKNSVGAGDSMVAGFTGAMSQTGDALEAFKWGVACGSATAFSEDLAETSFIKQLYQQVEVEKV
ncbi:1-phosphofructokinase [Tuanshanicoccus lijuaniae]|uniref:1-phosphofructokinase n=1 Tax=Aerococcaceae bacterium zg-1292 TaxID=2774330 RepID=UPI001BD82B75|nr:1-phosphofructokinase [Aerococcaceae bacterium zg-BR9]MBF6977877.1 1-phosphofructokinase [Aerococcaceae bacterium zg-BR22]MBS4455917.1 1-phosphofructokinase [Aerococcaceae bacterium zg-A91]MBS4457545.1 1-phosphofructokinase [Aerococcaceae bacterium zg-BR33]